MLKRVHSAIKDATRRRRAPRTLIEFASRLEFDAAGLRSSSQDLSPARLAAVVGDVSLACEHLAAAAEAWGFWLASQSLAVAPVDAGAIVDAHDTLRSLSADLHRARSSASAVGASLVRISRLDRRPR